MVPSNYPAVKRRCSKELSRWGCGFVDGGDVGCCFGNENTLRNDDYAVVLDRPLQVRTDVIRVMLGMPSFWVTHNGGMPRALALKQANLWLSARPHGRCYR